MQLSGVLPRELKCLGKESFPRPPWLRKPFLRIREWTKLANEMSESAEVCEGCRSLL
jgi:hypothetical protein